MKTDKITISQFERIVKALKPLIDDSRQTDELHIPTEKEIMDICVRHSFIIRDYATKWECYKLGWKEAYKAIINLIKKS